MGQKAGQHLIQKLSEQGIQTGEIVAEDWGYYIPIKFAEFKMAICCGHQNGDDDQFLCFTDPRTPMVRKFFRKIDVSKEFARLTEAMQQILSSDPEIRDIVWSEPQ